MLSTGPRWVRGVSLRLAAAGLVAALATGCEDQPEPESPVAARGEVVVYTALDRQFSEPILDLFTARTGIEVRAAYDTESTKTVGLANRIRAEASRPRCDVFWNNEILNTLRLQSEGLLQPCAPPQAEFYPAQYRDPDGYWYGFAARARVIIVNTEQVRPEEMPRSVRDLAKPRWRGRVGIAKPLFGTTASHVACLFGRLGAAKAKRLLASLKANDIQVVAGNKTCAEMVAGGRLALGLTDTDDALIELEAGKPVRIVFPDTGTGGMGTLLLPNTLAVVKGAPHAEAAQELIDFLLSPEVEERLAKGPSAQIPLHRNTPVESRVCKLSELRTMKVNFSLAAKHFAAAAEYIQAEFLN